MAEAAKKSADKKAPEKGAAPAEKSGKGLIIVLIAVIVVGAAAAGGVIFWMKSHGGANSAPAREEPAKPGAPEIFVPLEPPFVVNFQSDQSVRFLQVAVQVMTHDQKTADLLKQRDPVIRNDLLLLFGGQKVEEMSTREGKEKLQSEALEAVRRIVADGGAKPATVEGIYFTSFVMQ